MRLRVMPHTLPAKRPDCRKPPQWQGLTASFPIPVHTTQAFPITNQSWTEEVAAEKHRTRVAAVRSSF